MSHSSDTPAQAALAAVLDSLVERRRREFEASGQPARPVPWFRLDRQAPASEQARQLLSGFKRVKDRDPEGGVQSMLFGVAHLLDQVCYERGLTPQDFDSGLGAAAQLLDALVAVEVERSAAAARREETQDRLRRSVPAAANWSTSEEEFLARLDALGVAVERRGADAGRGEGYAVGLREEGTPGDKPHLIDAGLLWPSLALSRLRDRWSAADTAARSAGAGRAQLPRTRQEVV